MKEKTKLERLVIAILLQEMCSQFWTLRTGDIVSLIELSLLHIWVMSRQSWLQGCNFIIKIISENTVGQYAGVLMWVSNVGLWLIRNDPIMLKALCLWFSTRDFLQNLKSADGNSCSDCANHHLTLFHMLGTNQVFQTNIPNVIS